MILWSFHPPQSVSCGGVEWSGVEWSGVGWSGVGGVPFCPAHVTTVGLQRAGSHVRPHRQQHLTGWFGTEPANNGSGTVVEEAQRWRVHASQLQFHDQGYEMADLGDGKCRWRRAYAPKAPGLGRQSHYSRLSFFPKTWCDHADGSACDM